ncbi:glutathione S-transferase N-terminal domain-containing protein [Rickettsiales bacterium]|nr:glutathione S-transferase N-terminal domain-containing protein [Rickettsiales bacterium]
MRVLLYSFRRCPYAIRARLALKVAKIDFITEEINLKNKKKSFLTLSSKGTVPVLVLNNTEIIDESLDIMLWAFEQKKLNNLFEYNNIQQMKLIKETESDFKPHLDNFKYSSYLKPNQKQRARGNCEAFLLRLENLLIKNKFLFNSLPLISDYAIVPFIRQFFFSDKTYYSNSKFYNLSKWLKGIISSSMFVEIMQKKS